MGIAIIIPDADFSAKNLGNVTITTESELTTITVTGNITVSGETATYGVVYNPGVPSAKKGVVYSIVSGSQYASIDASTGVLTILSGAAASAVTVKATSTYNNTIFETLDITVTYKEKGIIDLSAGIGYFKGSSVLDPYANGGCVVFIGELALNSNYGNNTLGHSMIGTVSGFGQNSYYIPNATMNFQDKRNVGGATKECWRFETTAPYSTKYNSILYSAANGIVVDGVSKTSAKSTMQGGGGGNFGFGRINKILLDDSYDNTILLAKIQEQKDAGIVFPTSANRTIKIKNFLVFNETDYSSIETALANRQYADIDLMFDDNDVPYNGGTNKSITFISASYE